MGAFLSLPFWCRSRNRTTSPTRSAAPPRTISHPRPLASGLGRSASYGSQATGHSSNAASLTCPKPISSSAARPQSSVYSPRSLTNLDTVSDSSRPSTFLGTPKLETLPELREVRTSDDTCKSGDTCMDFSGSGSEIPPQRRPAGPTSPSRRMARAHARQHAVLKRVRRDDGSWDWIRPEDVEGWDSDSGPETGSSLLKLL